MNLLFSPKYILKAKPPISKYTNVPCESKLTPFMYP